MVKAKGKKKFPSLAEGRTQRTLIMDTEVFDAIERYANDQRPRVKRNTLIQDVMVGFLTGKGYWPPKL